MPALIVRLTVRQRDIHEVSGLPVPRELREVAEDAGEALVARGVVRAQQRLPLLTTAPAV